MKGQISTETHLQLSFRNLERPLVDFYLDPSVVQKDHDHQNHATKVNLAIDHANVATDHVVAVVTALAIAVQQRVTMKGKGQEFKTIIPLGS